MAKITIEIEDTDNGAVQFRTNPTRQEMMKLTKDDMTVAHVYAIHAITAIMKRDKETAEQVEKLNKISDGQIEVVQ